MSARPEMSLSHVAVRPPRARELFAGEEEKRLRRRVRRQAVFGVVEDAGLQPDEIRLGYLVRGERNLKYLHCSQLSMSEQQSHLIPSPLVLSPVEWVAQADRLPAVAGFCFVQAVM